MKYSLLLLFGLALGAGCSTSQNENSPTDAGGGDAAAAAERPRLPTSVRPTPGTTGAAGATAAPTEAEAPFDPTGISRRYMGRQIARVLGHENNAYFDRPAREREERPDLLLKALNLRPTDLVADVGAGTGYLTFRLAPLVPQGTVYAVEIQPQQMLRLTNDVMSRGMANVMPVRGTTQSLNLAPNSVDVVLLNDAYHEFAYPKEMLSSITRALRPKGRVVLVEYRPEATDISLSPVHRMSIGQARQELTAAGLTFRSAPEILPRQNMLIFEKLPE